MMKQAESNTLFRLSKLCIVVIPFMEAEGMPALLFGRKPLVSYCPAEDTFSRPCCLTRQGLSRFVTKLGKRGYLVAGFFGYHSRRRTSISGVFETNSLNFSTSLPR